MPSDVVVMENSSEWMAACAVQQRFMRRLGPRNTDPVTDKLDVSARCRQVHELGGDFYDFVPLPENCLALAVGDASGKGLAAALMISNVQSSLRTAALFAGDNGAAALRSREQSGVRIVARGAVRHIILRRFRRTNASTALRECRPPAPHGHSTRRLRHLA